MKLASVAPALFIFVASMVVPARAETPAWPAEPEAASSRTEISVETFASKDPKAASGCTVAQQGMQRTPLLSWSTIGEARPQAAGRFELVPAPDRCGTGALTLATSGSEHQPFITVETSVTAVWDPGPMDPGPVPVIEIALVLTARQITGFSPEGKPIYHELTTEHRTIRLGDGEEFALPVALADAQVRESLGVHDLFVRIRATQAGRPGAIEYGSVWIEGAVPGSEITLDGGVAGHAEPDGTALLRTVAVGERKVGIHAQSRKHATVADFFIDVVRGRTVVVLPNAADADASEQLRFEPIGKNTEGFEELRRGRDNAVMVRIPEGEFTMGNLQTEGQPLPHTVSVSAFLMDKLPVTWRLFKRFAAAAGRPLPPRPYWGVHEDDPVAFVRWDEARAYCEWAGGRLPTEAEREKAARGTDLRKFPWGNEEPTPDRGVFRREWGYAGNDTVGIRPAGASPYGLLDTGGNMWEWCDDWYAPDAYQSSPRDNPLGPRTGRAHVVRGGSWDSRPTVLSASCRNWGYVGYREGDFGFRCAADAPSAK